MPQKHNKSQSRKAQYATYKTQSRYAANKKAKLERHLKKYPNDEKAKQALKDISSTPKRGTPKNSVWSPSKIWLANWYSNLGMNGNIALSSKHEEEFKDDVIGHNAPHILDKKK